MVLILSAGPTELQGPVEALRLLQVESEWTQDLGSDHCIAGRIES
jgi:hypothetical protein